ncbi:MAG: hypothetical protein EOP84_15675 [Verrucomicrobiaceae bacterium]|nr:MAG: hypothetical protein EOP84_15675 [Verrucomicrobiaceae bacterium]
MTASGAAVVSFDFAAGLRASADPIPYAQEALRIHRVARFKEPALNPIVQGDCRLDAGLPIKNVGLVAQPIVLVSLHDARRIAQIVGPAGDRYNQLVAVLTGIGANNMEVRPLWIMCGARRNKKGAGPRNH